MNELLSELTMSHQYMVSGVRGVVNLYWFAIRNTLCEVPGLHSGNLWHSFPGRRKDEDGIMTCFFPHHRDQFSVSSQGRETTGCSEFLLTSPCQVQPSSSQEIR